MIIIKDKPVIARLLFGKTCCTIIVTNYEKCPVSFFELIQKAFITNTTQYYPDLICVVPIDSNFPAIRTELFGFCSWTKVENL